MRIGILTQPLGHNYGGILQNWAFQQILIKLGHNPFTIKHYGISKTKKFRRDIYAILAYLIKHLILHPNRKYNELPYHKRDTRRLQEFVKTNIRQISGLPVVTYELLRKEKIDFIVVGSDQVWRPIYNGSYLPNMFCSFLKSNSGIKCISYAASFGVDNWELSLEETEQAKDGLRNFSAISVREESGVKLCNDYLQRKAVQVLDPTLLLCPADYIKLISENECQLIPEDHIGVYILDMSTEKIRIVDEICQFLNKQAFYFGIPEKNTGLMLSVQSWIASFEKCSFIITDSFHGTAFSVNFHKPFISVVNHNRGADRFNSLLNLFDLRGRMIEDTDLEKINGIINSDINWEAVDARLNSLRAESLDFIKTYLQ